MWQTFASRRQCASIEANTICALCDYNRIESGRSSEIKYEDELFLYACYFQSLSETNEDGMGQTLQDNVHFILTDPPYNIRCINYYPNSYHDQFKVQEIKQLVHFSESILKREVMQICFVRQCKYFRELNI